MYLCLMHEKIIQLQVCLSVCVLLTFRFYEYCTVLHITYC